MISPPPKESSVYVVDDDADLGASVARLLTRHGFISRSFSDPAAVLTLYEKAPVNCIVTDVIMDDIDGFNFARQIACIDPTVAMIFMTAWPTAANAVDSIKRYAGFDYLEKPIDENRLIGAVAEAIDWSIGRRDTVARTAALSPRERQVFDLLVLGYPNKIVADILGLSIKTIEDHRSAVFTKTGALGLAQLIALSR